MGAGAAAMVFVAEGVARSLDPNLNMWTAAEPVVRAWLEEQLGPGAQMRDAVANAGALAAALRQAPQLIENSARLAQALSEERAAASTPPRSRLAVSFPLWIAAAALIVIAAKLLLG